MKKIISVVVILAMMSSILCIGTSAAGVLLDMKFKSMESFTESFHAGNFYVPPEGGMLYGYNEARALQTKYNDTENGYFEPAPYCWLEYDTTVDIIIDDDDIDESHRSVSVIYANDNPYYFGTAEERMFMSFIFDIDNGLFRLTNGWEGYEDSQQIVDPVPAENIDVDGADTHTMGISVERGRIRCFFDDELVIDFVDTADDYGIAKEIVSPFLFWQRGNFVQIKNIKVSTPAYLFPHPEDESTETVTSEPSVSATEGTENGGENAGTSDEPADATSNTENTDNDNANNENNEADNTTRVTSETTTAIVTSVVTNEQGETSIVTSIVTEATTTPGAETNKKPAKPGNATTTGDATFVVIAAMVAALGCAVIVKKVNVK